MIARVVPVVMVAALVAYAVCVVVGCACVVALVAS